MDILTIVAAVHDIPYGGPILVWLPFIIMAGSFLAAISPAPGPTGYKSTPAYAGYYRFVQWCAINVNWARNAVDPKAPMNQLTSYSMGTAAPRSNAWIPVLFAPLLMLSACANPPTAQQMVPNTARKAVAEIGLLYASAANTLIAYDKLPRCGPNVIALCSKADVVISVGTKLQLAAQDLKLAEEAVDLLPDNTPVTAMPPATAAAVAKATASAREADNSAKAAKAGS